MTISENKYFLPMLFIFVTITACWCCLKANCCLPHSSIRNNYQYDSEDEISVSDINMEEGQISH